MKLKSLTTTAVALPNPLPYATTPDWRIEAINAVVVELATDDGVVGISYAFALNKRHLKPLHAFIESMWELLDGQDPVPIDRLWQRMNRDARSVSMRGLGQIAITALDVALWDLQGKLFGQPVYKLLGGNRDRIATYASYDLWPSAKPDDLAKRGAAFVKEGFRAMKPRASMTGDAAYEAQRLKALREAVGPKVELMLDVATQWNASQAIRIGRVLEPYRLFWLEDPVGPEDYDGLTQVAAALDTPIAAGELHYTKHAFRQLIDQRCVDIVMIDLQRVGGFTEWRKVAAYAEAHSLPVVSHLAPELSVHPMCGIANGLTVEYLPWGFPLFKEVPPVVDGKLVPFQKPGLGLELDLKNIKKYKL